MEKKFTVINGILIYATTALMTLIIHEAGHFIAEILWGFKAIMHNNYGSYSGIATDTQKIIIAAAGPIVSLIQGLILYNVSCKVVNKGIFSLFTLWMSLHGFILFAGYLVCSPFFIYGDTGQVFYLLHFPIYITYIVALAGILILIRTLQALAKHFNVYGQGISDHRSRINQLILYPIIFGGIISLVLQLPVPNFLLLFASVTTPLIFLIVYGQLITEKTDNATVSIYKLSIPVIIIFILTAFIVRFLV